MAGGVGDKPNINRLSEEIISMTAAKVAMQVSGVNRLNETITGTLTKKFSGREKAMRYVRVSREEEGIVIDVYVTVDYGVRIPELAWEIQRAVKQAVEAVVEIPVKKVNIHVQGVSLSKKLPQEG